MVQNCLMVTWWHDEIIYVCKKCSNFQNSKLIFMINDFKFFPTMLFWDSWIVVYCRFVTKKKLHFSLICRFYCCFVKKGWDLKVAKHFVFLLNDIIALHFFIQIEAFTLHTRSFFLACWVGCIWHKKNCSQRQHIFFSKLCYHCCFLLCSFF